MKAQLDKLMWVKALTVKALFFLYEVIQSHLSPGRKMKILFPDRPDSKHFIRRIGFFFIQHEIAFGNFPCVKINDYDLVVPLSISDVKYLNEVRHLIINNPIPIPSMETILLCDDKYLLNQALIMNGFRDNIPKVGDMQDFPYIVKKRIDDSGANSHIIFDSHHEQSLSDIIGHAEYFTQEFITGRYEYVTHIIFKNNAIVCSLTIRYAFATETPIKWKDKPTFRTIVRCPYLDMFASILKTIRFEGICSINYKVRDNLPLIFEINPRFGGSLGPYFFSFIKYLK